jgi:hypothetical protein
MKPPAFEPPLHPRLQLLTALTEGLIFTAVAAARLAAESAPTPKHSKGGQTLRPGAGTPLWNTLAAAARAELKRHGDQAKLARILGIPRQRLHEMLKSRRHLPDAERTLLLLVWLQARRAGQDLG